jgi:DNA-binding CsgD family transcriptional regulator
MSIIELDGFSVPSPRVLSRREKLVLARLAQDMTVQEVAKSLYVSHNTVKTQLRSAYRKLGVSSRAEAVQQATRLALAP